MSKTTKNVVEMKRSDAAALIDRIRLALAKERTGRRPSPLCEDLEKIFKEADVPLPKPCSGEAHTSPHVDNCGVCLHGLAYEWAGKPVKVK